MLDMITTINNNGCWKDMVWFGLGTKGILGDLEMIVVWVLC